MTATRGRGWRWLRRLVVLVIVAAAARVLFDAATRIDPPALPPPAPRDVTYDGETARVGASYLARRSKLWVMQVAGDPVGLGYQHARLASPLMAEGDGRMLALFSSTVPSRSLRAIVGAIVRARYRRLDRAFPADRRAEIYGESVGYADSYVRLPDVSAPRVPALALRHRARVRASPLLACTAFVASGPATASGHTIVGRNLDFDVDPWFDDDNSSRSSRRTAASRSSRSRGRA